MSPLVSKATTASMRAIGRAPGAHREGRRVGRRAASVPGVGGGLHRRWAQVARSPRWGLAAAGWSAAFATGHFLWALGGSRGLAESAGDQLARERPLAFVVLGLWGVGLLLLLAAAIGALLAVHQLSGTRRRILLLVGAAIAGLLLFRAVLVEFLLVFQVPQAVSEDQRYWTLAFWNPWFLVGGLTFALAVNASRLSPSGRSGSAGAR